VKTLQGIMSILKKTLLIGGGIFALIFVIALLIISPLAKRLIEKYDVEYTGREITLERAYVNPFTGNVRLSDLVVYELESDSIFFTAKALSVNFSLIKLLSKKYVIKQLTITQPKAYFIKYEEYLNITDLMEKFSSTDSIKTAKETVYFSLLDIRIKDGIFHYDEAQTPASFFIKNVNIESEGLRHEVDTMNIDFSFLSGMGSGEVNGDITINVDNNDYRLAVKVDSFDLEIINQYLKDLTNYGTFTAMLDADMRSSGNFNTVDSLSATGNISVTKFHFGKSRTEDFVSFDQLVLAINEVSPKNMVYHYDSICITNPFIVYERYDTLDNIQTMFGIGGKNVADVNADPTKFNLVIELVKLIEQISRNFFRSHYKIGRFAIYDGNIQYTDYTLADKFNIALHPINVRADSIDKDRDRIELRVNSAIKPYGEFYVTLSADPKDSSTFDFDYKLLKLPLPMFNPYITTYTSFPLDRGTLELTGSWRVRSGQIDSDNQLIVLDPRVSKKVRSKDSQWFPVPLAMAFVRERGNVVNYKIPIKGNLADPEFKLWDVFTDLLKNIFVKPVTTPYRMEVKSVEQILEKSLNMKWALQESTLTSDQEKFISKMAEFLQKTPSASININPIHYAQKEREYILFFEAKKKFFLANNKSGSKTFTKEDSVHVEKMSIRDEAFISYLDKQVNDALLFTVQHKAAQLIAQSLVNSKFAELKQAREDAFLSIFKKMGIDKQVTFSKGNDEIPFNGFSFYDIVYEGEYPDYLTKAYDKMNEMNSEIPREKYQDKRENIDALQ
jgi:hypothetical protein